MDDPGVVLFTLGNLHSLLRMHWDHEPTPNPSQEGTGQDADECLLPSWEGSGVGRFMERRFVSSHEVSLTPPRAPVPQPSPAIRSPNWSIVRALNRWLACLGLLITTSIHAQPVPRITSVSPEWVQRGTTSVVVLEGDNLSQINAFLFSGDGGLAATNAPPPARSANLESSRGGIGPADNDEKRLRVSVTAAPDAPLGARELRVAAPNGVSEPVVLNVDFLRQIVETGGHHDTNHAQLVDLPAAINGVIGQAAQTDFYRFKAQRDQRLIFDVYAFRAGSPLDSSLALLNAEGKELVRSEDVNGLDSLIDFTVPEDGQYFLQIRDFRYQGGKDFKYRIVAGESPYLDGIFPLGGQRGQSVEVTLRGRNLDGLSQMKLKIEPDAPLGQQEIRAHTARGYSNPVLFEVGELAELTETEPNNSPTNANPITLPAVINGRLGGEKDVDQFKFKVEKDQAFIFEIEASRFGSLLDAVLYLSDAKGAVIQQNDDAVGADARIEQRFAEAGKYFLRIRDLLERGGEDFAYRLVVRPPKPDFSVNFYPDTPQISRGGYAVIGVEVQRQAGFSGAVEARLESLPPGLSAEPLLVPPESTVSPLIVLHASEDAPLGHYPIKLAASGVIDGQPAIRQGKPQANGRLAREAFLTVLGRFSFEIEPITLSARVEQNQSTAIDLQVRRHNSFLGDIQVSAEGFSSGKEPLTRNLELQSVTLKGADTRATMKLKAKLDSETGTRLILFKGEAKVDGRSLTQYSRAFPLTIDPVPFTLANSLPRLAVTALPPDKKSAASEAEFSVKANRRGWFTDEINLSVEGVPEGLVINSTNIARGASEAGFKIVATDKASAGKEVSLSVVGTANVNGRAYQFRGSPIVVTVNAPAAEAAGGAEHVSAAK